MSRVQPGYGCVMDSKPSWACVFMLAPSRWRGKPNLCFVPFICFKTGSMYPDCPGAL